MVYVAWGPKPVPGYCVFRKGVHDMAAVAASPVDVAKEFQSKIGGCSVAYAHGVYLHERKTWVFTTFFEEIDSEAEEQLSRVESYMVDAFREYAIEFRTIHLFSRDVANFIPQGAIPLIESRIGASQRASAS